MYRFSLRIVQKLLNFAIYTFMIFGTFGTFGTFFIPYFKLSFILDSFFSFSPFYFFLKVSNKRIEMSQISQNIPSINRILRCIDFLYELYKNCLTSRSIHSWFLGHLGHLGHFLSLISNFPLFLILSFLFPLFIFS